MVGEGRPVAAPLTGGGPAAYRRSVENAGATPGAVPFGRYVLTERIAQGGMGEVFRAVAVGERGFEKPVVVKRILPEHAGRGDLADLFVAEAKLMTRLAHPNIVEVLDFGRGEGGDYFLVLELVEGVDLGRLHRAFAARGERFPAPLALFVVAQVLRGLHHAHGRAAPDAEGSAGLVHRDVSPGNVLLSAEGEVKVADFGVALVRRGDAPSAARGVVGKPAYMAPEQFEGRDVDPRADVFSAGVVLFELCTGSLPFDGQTADEQQDAARRGDFGRARDAAVDVSPPIDALIRRALAPSPEDRFPDARAMAQAIEALRATGQAVATGDDVAEAVRAAMREAPKGGRRVIALSADRAPEEGGDDLAERELTRTGGAGGTFSFTLVTTGNRAGTVRIDRRHAEPSADEPPRAEPGTVKLAARAPEAGTDPPELPIERSSVRARLLFAGLLAAAIAIAVAFGKRSAPEGEARSVPSADPSARAASAGRPAPERRDPEPIASASAQPIASSAPPRPPAPARTSAAPAIAPAASTEPAREDCKGGVRIASNGSWTVSGGPATVQSPGVYTWRCGTFSLVATSRADPGETKRTTVTVRDGATATVDLR